MKVGDLVISLEEFWNDEVGLVVDKKPWHQDGYRVRVLMPDGEKYWFFHDQLKVVTKQPADKSTQCMKVGDLVEVRVPKTVQMHEDWLETLFPSPVKEGVGLVLEVENWRPTYTLVCVMIEDETYWFSKIHLKVINNTDKSKIEEQLLCICH